MRPSMMLALLLACAVSVWMLTGQLIGQTEAPGAQESTTAPQKRPSAPAQARMRVLVIDSTARSIDREVVARGQLEPWRRVTLRAETDGRVVELPAEKGARVESGRLLVKLAEDDRPAQLARAEAEVAARELELSASETLGQQGMQARTQIKNAQAALASARAELARLELDIERLSIRAPFAGVIEGREVELGSLLQRGDAVLELVDNHQLKATAQVPQQRAGALALGQPVEIELLDGTRASGELIYIARVADPQTRGFRVEVRVPNPAHRLPGGVSAELHIRTGEETGHFLSPAALTLNDEGDVGVRTLDRADRVHFLPVTLVRTERDGVWVTGLPEQARIITRGQGFVSEGEQVTPISAGSDT